MGFWSSLLPGSVGVKEISPAQQQQQQQQNKVSSPQQHPREHGTSSPFPSTTTPSRPATSAGPIPAPYATTRLARQFPAEPDLLPELVLPDLSVDEKKMPTKRSRGFSIGRRKTKEKDKEKEEKASKPKERDAKRAKKDEEFRRALASVEDVRRNHEEAKLEEAKAAERARLKAVHDEYRTQEIRRLQAQEDSKGVKEEDVKREEQRRLKVMQDEQRARDEAKSAELERKIQALEGEKSDKDKQRMAKEEEKKAAEARKQKAVEDEKRAKEEAKRAEHQKRLDEIKAAEDARKAEEQRKLRAREEERRTKEEEKRAAEEAKIKAKEDEKLAKEEEKRAKEEEKLRAKEEKWEAKQAKIEARKSMDDTRSIVSVSTTDGRRRLTKRRPSTSMGSRPSSRASRVSMDRPRTAGRDSEPPVPRLSISSPDPPVLPPIAPMLPLLEHERESGNWSDGIVLPGMAVTTDQPVKSAPVSKPERADNVYRHHYRDSDLMSFNRKRSQSAAYSTTPHERQTSWLPPTLEAPTRAPPPIPPPTNRNEPPRPKTSGGAEARRSNNHFATLSLNAFGPGNGQSSQTSDHASSHNSQNLRNRRSLLDMDADLPMLFPMPPAPGLIHDGEITPTSSSANTHSRSGSQEHHRVFGSESPSLRRDVLSKPRTGTQRSPPMASNGFQADNAVKKVWSDSNRFQQPQTSAPSSGTRGESTGDDGTNSFDLLREEQEKEWGKLKKLMEGADKKEKERSNNNDNQPRIRSSNEDEEDRLRQFDFANAQALAAFDFNDH